MKVNGFPERLGSVLEDYSDDVAGHLHRIVKVGRVSCETMLDIVESLETEFAVRSAERVFGVIPRPEVFSDEPQLFGERLTVEDVHGPAHYIADL